MDEKSQAIIDGLHPKFRDSMQKAWEEAQSAMPPNVKIILVSGIRTFAESDALYAQGRTRPGQKVTNAMAGQSYHNYGLAADFEMFTDEKPDWAVGPNWLKVVAIMESYGMYWGGHFPEGFHDNPHFENRYGYNWRELLALYNAGKFITGSKYVDF